MTTTSSGPGTIPLDRTAGADRIPLFDFLRAVALILVFAFHYAGFAAPLTHGLADAIEWTAGQMGSLGTNLLLLLSGYFIAQSISAPNSTYGRFLTVRLVRIYGPYCFVLAVAAAFGALFPYYLRGDATDVTLWKFLEQLILIPGVFPDRPVLTVTWTLSLIVPGYVLLGAAGYCLPAKVRPRVLFWMLLTAATLLAGLYWELPIVRFAYMPAGCMVYDARQRATGRIRNRLWTVGAIVFLVFLLRIAVGSGWPSAGWPALASRGLFTGSGIVTVAGLVTICTVLHQAGERKWWTKPLAAFGRTGYSFYLVHGPVVKLFALSIFPAVSAAWYWWLMPFCLALCVAAALGLYVCVERPCRELMRSQPPMRAVGAAA